MTAKTEQYFLILAIGGKELYQAYPPVRGRVGPVACSGRMPEYVPRHVPEYVLKHVLRHMLDRNRHEHELKQIALFQ